MTPRLALLAMSMPCWLSAQPRVDEVVERIEKWAGLEQRRLGLDTRIRAAESLRVIAPAAATRLLEGGLPDLGEPDYFTLRVLSTFAAIDLDAAEDLLPALPGRVWAFTALIDQAGAQRDFARALALARAARAEGLYSLGAVVELIRRLGRDDPRAAAAFQDEMVTAFPASSARLVDVQLLLRYAIESSPVDSERGRKAARLAAAALADEAVRSRSAAGYEDTASFLAGGRKIQTATTYETAQFQTAAFLAVFDPEAYRRLEGSLPEWKSALGGVAAADLLPLVRTLPVRRAKPAPAQGAPQPRPDVTKMPYDEAMRSAAAAPADHRAPMYLIAARRDGIDRERRERALRLALESLDAAPVTFRYSVGGGILQDAVTHHLDDLLPEAVGRQLAALDAAAASDDEVLRGAQERGDFGRQFAGLARLADEGRIRLPGRHPSVEAQRALRAIGDLRLTAQDFTLADQDGARRRLSDFRGKVVVLDFWATWCEPCRKALPEVEKLYREWSGKDVVVLGVDDESAEVVRAFAAKQGMSYPTLIDPGRNVHNLFGVSGIPAAIVIGRDGTLVERVPHPHNEANFRAALRKAGIQ